MTDELGRQPAIARGPITSLPAPGAGHIPDGAVPIADAPAIGSRFGIFHTHPQPIGPFVMVELVPGTEPLVDGGTERRAVTRWRVRPDAIDPNQNETLIIQPMARGRSLYQWSPAEEIEGEGNIGWFKGVVFIPSRGMVGQAPHEHDAAPAAGEQHEQGGP